MAPESAELEVNLAAPFLVRPVMWKTEFVLDGIEGDVGVMAGPHVTRLESEVEKEEEKEEVVDASHEKEVVELLLHQVLPPVYRRSP